MSLFASVFGPLQDLWYASFSRGRPPEIAAIDDSHWQQASALVDGLSLEERQRHLEALKRSASLGLASDQVAHFQPPEASLRWVLTLLLAHDAAVADRASGQARSTAELQQAFQACAARLFSDPALVAHERLAPDLGPFLGLFMAGPYLFRLSSPLFVFAPFRWVQGIPGLGLTVGLVLGLFWILFAYFDWVLAGLFMVGYLAVDRLLGPSDARLRRYERAWGDALLGGSLAGRRALREVWRDRRGRADTEELLGWALCEVVALQLQSSPPARSRSRSWPLRAFGPARLLGGVLVVLAVWAWISLSAKNKPPPPPAPGQEPPARTSPPPATTRPAPTIGGAPLTSSTARPTSSARSINTCILEAAASSAQQSHPASHAFDGTSSTAWNENSKGDGVGEWVEARFAPGTFLAHVNVGGGWSSRTAQGQDLWALNNSFRTMKVSWNGGSQEVSFQRQTDRGRTQRVDINAQVTFVRFEAVAVDHGKFQDLCLDEATFFGACPVQP